MELPPYRVPGLRNLALGLWERRSSSPASAASSFALTILLWFLASWPAPPAGAAGAAIQYSLAGMLGHALQHVFAPIGFNWQISIALVPGMAAREVAVGALGTVYALSARARRSPTRCRPVLAHEWIAGHRVRAARLVRVRAAVPRPSSSSGARPTPGAIRC